VKSHLVYGNAVHPRFGFGQSGEHLLGQGAELAVEPRTPQQSSNLGVIAMLVSVSARVRVLRVAVIMVVMVVMVVMGVAVPMLMGVPVHRIVLVFLAGKIHREAQSDESAALTRLETHLQLFQAQRPDRVTHDLLRDTRIHQGRDGHITRHARARVEMQMQSRRDALAGHVRTRLSSDAMRPAPKPLSIFTTATPVAHELSMVKSAAIPPMDAP